MQNSKIVRHVKKKLIQQSHHVKKREKMGENEIEKEITSAQKLSGKKTDRQKTFQFSSPQDKLPFH